MQPLNAGILAARLDTARWQIRRARTVVYATGSAWLAITISVSLAAQPGVIGVVAVTPGLAAVAANWYVSRAALHALDVVRGAQ